MTPTEIYQWLVLTLAGAIACYRLWRAVAVDEICDPGRHWLTTRKGPAWGWTYRLITCAWCLGFWLCVGLQSVVAWLLHWPWWSALGGALVSSALLGLFALLVEGLERLRDGR